MLYASPSRSGIQGIATDVEGVLLDPRERSLIDIDTHLKWRPMSVMSVGTEARPPSGVLAGLGGRCADLLPVLAARRAASVTTDQASVRRWPMASPASANNHPARQMAGPEEDKEV